MFLHWQARHVGSPVDVLLVGGGGSGSWGLIWNDAHTFVTSGTGGGGGGGGCLATTVSLSANVTYAVTVGTGGLYPRNSTPGELVVGNGNPGSSSVFGSEAAAGGQGGIDRGQTGSGGTTATSPGGGYSGYYSNNPGGGGGASSAGNGQAGYAGGAYPYNASGGNGAAGISSSITGTITYYGGGGGGGAGGGVSYGRPGDGGLGGGGHGNQGPFERNNDATPNTGGGGGGGWDGNNHPGDGADGLVIIKIPTDNYSGIYTGNVVVTTISSYTVLKFTGNGSYTTSGVT